MLSHTVDGASTTYGYDAASQLVSETRSGYSASYSFDGNGNRLSRTVNGLVETYAYDAGDKLLSVTWAGGSKTYGYDAAGRTTSVTSAAGTTSIAYDWQSRITSMTGPGLSQTNTYNGLDTRVTKNAQSFLRDGAYVTDPVLRDGNAAYTPGISERRGSTTTFQHSGLKNADAQSSVAQSVTAARQYDAFGNLASSSGTWQGPFGYAGGFGYQTESDSGLMLLGHRYLDPSTGRFLTRDPAKEGRNWYGYVGNNPTRRFDDGGLRATFIGLAISAGGLLSGSLSLGIWTDVDSGTSQWGVTLGGGSGLGYSGSVGFQRGYDPLITLDGGSQTIDVSGTASQIVLETPVVGVEGTWDEGGFQGGWNVTGGFGAGGGIFFEKRRTWIFEVGGGNGDPAWGSGDAPKPNGRVEGTPWHNPKYY